MHSCFTAARGEFKGPMFGLVEHSNDTLTNNDNSSAPCLDIVQTFSPRPRILHIGIKFFLAAWIVSILASSIRKKDHPSFWLAYLTHWGFLATTAYSLMSVLVAIYLAVRPPANTDKLEGGTGLLIKTTWALFALAFPVEVMITILYWVLEYDGDGVEYVSFMVHGGGMVIIVFDGFVLSRIPLRMKQFILSEVFAVLYILWSAIHAYSGMGNPDADEGNDDALYATLAWKNNTAGAAALSAGLLCVANPVSFLVCRALSRLLPRRLHEEGEQQEFQSTK